MPARTRGAGATRTRWRRRRRIGGTTLNTRQTKAAARREVEARAARRVELHIEGYLAARRAQMKRLGEVACPYAGWEAEAWGSGWRVASQDAGRW